jgi:glycosyltransferase involved in cell wall biosynthesis
MRILIVTQYFPPEMGAPQARLHELGVRLRDLGHEVTVLTAMPNYPTGRVFAGYRRRLRTEEGIDGMRVVRTWIWPSKSTRWLPRLWSYLTFAVSSVLLGSRDLGRHDAVLVESPPLFLVPSGLLIGRLARGRVIMNVSDIWPDILVRMGVPVNGVQLKLLEFLERAAYRGADAVAVTNPGAARQIEARFPGVETALISNGVDTRIFAPSMRSETWRCRMGAPSDELLVGYAGLHGLAQGLEVVLEAAELLVGEPVRFALIGDGPTKRALEEDARARSLTNITFLERVPKSEMPRVVASLDLALVPLRARLPGTMPSKIYEALACGVPVVVAKGCEGEILVDEFGVGWTYEPLDGSELAKAILDFVNGHGRDEMRGRCVGLAQRFDRDRIASHTEAVLEALARHERLPQVGWY